MKSLLKYLSVEEMEAYSVALKALYLCGAESVRMAAERLLCLIQVANERRDADVAGVEVPACLHVHIRTDDLLSENTAKAVIDAVSKEEEE